MVCGRPAELAAWMRDLAAAGLPVAMVLGGVGAQDPDGVEVLAAVRAIDPTALRVAAVRWGDWESVRSVFDAVTAGTIDHWVTRPVQAPAEEFHRWITEFLREWSSQRGGGFEAAWVIGERWSARSQELRDLSPATVSRPAFMTPPPRPAGRCCTNSAWNPRPCRLWCSGSGLSGQHWSTPPTWRSLTRSA